MNIKENNNLNENIKSNSNILSMFNDEILKGNTIPVSEFTFAAIQSAVNSANDGDTISLKEGTYLNNGHGQININQNISFVGVKGLSILDAMGQSRIFNVQTNKINIENLTFINGKANNGAAIYFNKEIFNSTINATFINNTATNNGGANYFRAGSNINVIGTYINNTANDGGSNYFYNDVTDSNITGTYTSNNAKNDGGANRFNNQVLNTNIDGIYNNNTATHGGGANHFNNQVSNTNITGIYNNNTASFGGVNYFYNRISESNISGKYTNNNAKNHGGVNYLFNRVSDSSISGTYINNTAKSNGGANYISSQVSNTNITGTYTNNTAKSNGGANYFSTLSNSNITGTYTNNTATNNGGAIYVSSSVSNSNITGTYTNNTATNNGGVNYFTTVSNSNITGTYTNNIALQGNGGVNYFTTVSNSNITGTYTNNSALQSNGGANHFTTVSNSNITGTYTNNNAKNDGGANCFHGEVSNSNITGICINNTAICDGGANYFKNNVLNSNIGGTYINNTAGSVIYFYENSGVELNVSINYGIFLNNNCDYVILVRRGSVDANNNWFGNNASDYNEKPKTKNVKMNNWLFLNATSNPNTLSLNESSDILFKLYSTDGNDVSDFDNTQLAVINLTLTSTNGNIDTNNSTLDNNIKYTAAIRGEGSVTAKVENAEHTIYLKNMGKNAELSVTAQDITYTENETLTLTYNDTATGKVNITLKSKNYNKTIASDINQTITLRDLPAGEYNVTVEYLGDEIFSNSTANASFIVKKITTEISTNTTINLFVGDESKINYTLKPADAVGDISFSSNDTNIITVDPISCSLKAKSKGSVTITVNFSGSENYTESNTTISITVDLNDACVDADDMLLNVGEISAIQYTTNPEGLNVTFINDNSGIVNIDKNGIITALKEGTANITITIGDDKKYTFNSTTITVTVKLNNASITAKDITLNVGEISAIQYTNNPEGLNVTFINDNSGIVNIDKNGIITALKEGTANITVIVGDNKKYAMNSTTIYVDVYRLPIELPRHIDVEVVQFSLTIT